MKKIDKLKSMMIMVAILLGIGFGASAQDVIVFNDGSIEQAKILEVGDDVVKYKKWDNQDGPTFSANKGRILSIYYQDGTKENFANQQQQNHSQSKQQTETKGFQQKRDGGFSIHFGAAFPLGDFGKVDLKKDSDGDSYPEDLALSGEGKSGGAGTGFNVGFKGKIALPVNGLGVIISGDFVYNGMNADIREYVEDYQNYYEEDGDTWELKKPRYLNIPILVGINYAYKFNNTIGIWGEAGVGVNFRKITNIKMEISYDGEYSSGSETNIYKYKLGTSFAFQVGAGVMIKDLFSVGLHFYGLGSSKIKGTYEWEYDAYAHEYGGHYSGGDSESFTFKKLSSNLFMLRLGFHF